MTFWHVHASVKGHTRITVYIYYYYVSKIRTRYINDCERKSQADENDKGVNCNEKKKNSHAAELQCAWLLGSKDLMHKGCSKLQAAGKMDVGKKEKRTCIFEIKRCALIFGLHYNPI